MVNLKLETMRPVSRKMRRPRHTFYLKQKAYAVQPFMIAPVLPGETMKNLLLQSRTVTDPIKNKIIGWHLEYFFFYVRLTDLDGSADFQAMMLDPDKSMASYQVAATQANLYTYDDTVGGIDWVKYCLKRVTECYFREEGEAWDVVTHESLPGAGLNNKTWLDSAIKSADLPTGGAVPANVDDLNRAYETWQQLMAQSLINMDYEDFLRSYGITGQVVERSAKKPELLRYIRDWQYPSNTINSSTGAAVSAVSWATAERADKDRFFQEPGFIFGVSVVRPKVYYSNQRGALAIWMDRALDWFPAVMRDDPYTSLKEFDDAAGPLGGLTGGAGADYWVDLRDLLIHGDQFVNFDITAGSGAQNDIELPTTALTNAGKHYPTEAMVDTLYVTAGTDYVYQDGAVSLSILGTQQDNT